MWKFEFKNGFEKNSSQKLNIKIQKNYYNEIITFQIHFNKLDLKFINTLFGIKF